jgi:hypothetical protein
MLIGKTREKPTNPEAYELVGEIGSPPSSPRSESI